MRYQIKSYTELQNATKAICDLLAQSRVPGDRIFDCKLVVNELVGNILKHSSGVATLDCFVKSKSVEILVLSSAQFYPPAESRCSDVFAEGGRGLYLVDSVVSERSVTDEGAIKAVIKY
ncbi:MAG: ATP-binding protein [Clostridia bacterium]|nr:ATP-binding protein [Clostridia bacterium]